jgi:hypothetical protein
MSDISLCIERYRDCGDKAREAASFRENKMPIKLTRAQACAWLNEHGWPIKHSYFEYLCSPGIGKGPQVAGWFGPRCLYETADLDAWAQSRFIAATDVCADLGIDRRTLGRRVQGRIRGEAGASQ